MNFCPFHTCSILEKLGLKSMFKMPLSICEFRDYRLREDHTILMALNYIGACPVHHDGIIERL